MNLTHVAAAVALGLALAVPLQACGNSGDGERTIQVGAEEVPVTRLQDAATALCAARDEAGGDVMQANSTFYDRSHDALHTLARAVDQVDRAAAARLLEDKERVESDLRSDVPGPQLATDLDRLADSTRAALAAISVSVEPCR